MATRLLGDDEGAQRLPVLLLHQAHSSVYGVCTRRLGGWLQQRDGGMHGGEPGDGGSATTHFLEASHQVQKHYRGTDVGGDGSQQLSGQYDTDGILWRGIGAGSAPVGFRLGIGVARAVYRSWGALQLPPDGRTPHQRRPPVLHPPLLPALPSQKGRGGLGKIMKGGDFFHYFANENKNRKMYLCTHLNLLYTFSKFIFSVKLFTN